MEHKWKYIEYFVLIVLSMFSFVIHKVKGDVVSFNVFLNKGVCNF